MFYYTDIIRARTEYLARASVYVRAGIHAYAYVYARACTLECSRLLAQSHFYPLWSINQRWCDRDARGVTLEDVRKQFFVIILWS